MLQPFLNEYVRTLTITGAKRVTRILEDTRLEKVDARRLVDKLSNRQLFANLVLAKANQSSTISSGLMQQDFRDVLARLREVYGDANENALLVDSTFAILSSEIKALEDELNALEKSIANYAFLLADNGAYDFAHLEAFNDTRNEETELDFVLTDRAGLFFRPDEKAVVRPSEGVLALTEIINQPYPLIAAVVGNNASTFVTSDTGIQNSTNESIDTGWRMSFASPAPVTYTLPAFSGQHGFDQYSGVNVIAEYVLDSPSPADNIQITPFVDAPFRLVQVKAYPKADEPKYSNLLAEPRFINGVASVQFDLQGIEKFELLIQQEMYVRNSLNPMAVEREHQHLAKIDEDPFNNTDRPRSPFDYLGDMFHKEYYKRPNMDHIAGWGIMGDHDRLRRLLDSNSILGNFINSTVKNRTAQNFLFRNFTVGKSDFKMFPLGVTRSRSASDPNLRAFLDNRAAIPYPTYEPGVEQITPSPSISVQPELFENQAYKYEYNLGIRNIKVGMSDFTYKGVFISKVLPAPGDSGEVKIKTSETQYIVPDLDVDLGRVTSVEYSVTNVSKPDKEDLWVPIMPATQHEVIGERFFTDQLGKGYFRFPASTEEEIQLYKNNFLVTDFPLTDIIIRARNRQSILGLSLPNGFAAANDIFMVSYVPAEDHSIVNFEKAGFEDPPLTAAYDSNGAGEGFTTNDSQLTIQLKSKPYIDYTEVETAEYIENYGLSSYSPIMIRFDDGTIAYNLTNYKGGTQSVLDAGAGDYQFLHSDQTIIFNKRTTQAFRVYYQYLPSNVRFRAVLRCNYGSFVSPTVDYVQVKTKTRKADPLRDF